MVAHTRETGSPVSCKSARERERSRQQELRATSPFHAHRTCGAAFVSRDRRRGLRDFGSDDSDAEDESWTVDRARAGPMLVQLASLHGRRAT